MGHTWHSILVFSYCRGSLFFFDSAARTAATGRQRPPRMPVRAQGVEANTAGLGTEPARRRASLRAYVPVWPAATRRARCSWDECDRRRRRRPLRRILHDAPPRVPGDGDASTAAMSATTATAAETEVAAVRLTTASRPAIWPFGIIPWFSVLFVSFSRRPRRCVCGVHATRPAGGMRTCVRRYARARRVLVARAASPSRTLCDARVCVHVARTRSTEADALAWPPAGICAASDRTNDTAAMCRRHRLCLPQGQIYKNRIHINIKGSLILNDPAEWDFEKKN